MSGTMEHWLQLPTVGRDHVRPVTTSISGHMNKILGLLIATALPGLSTAAVQQPPPLPATFPCSPASVEIRRLTNDSDLDSAPSLGFASSSADGVACWARDIGWNTGNPCDYRHEMFFIGWGPTSWGTPTYVPTQASRSRHMEFAVGYRPATRFAHVSLN